MSPVEIFAVRVAPEDELDDGNDAAVDALLDPVITAAERAREILDGEEPNPEFDPEEPEIAIVDAAGHPFTAARLDRDGETNRFRIVLLITETEHG